MTYKQPHYSSGHANDTLIGRQINLSLGGENCWRLQTDRERELGRSKCQRGNRISASGHEAPVINSLNRGHQKSFPSN